MPQFSYKARKRSGELVEGVLEVTDRPAALSQIQRLGLFPIAVDAAKAGATLDGKHPDGWYPEQRLSVEEALRAYTQGAAYAAFEEAEKGSIAPGKLGDIVVLSDDLFTIPPTKIKDTRVDMTIVGGKIVYKVD